MHSENKSNQQKQNYVKKRKLHNMLFANKNVSTLKVMNDEYKLAL